MNIFDTDKLSKDKEVVDIIKQNENVKIEKIIAIREKGKTKVKPGMIRVTEYRPKFVSLKQRVENENKDLEF